MTGRQKEQRIYAFSMSCGRCEVCGKPLSGGQMQAAHRIGNTKMNRARYGSFVIDHVFNIGYVCSLKCNSVLDISRNPGEVTRLCARIYGAENHKYEVAKCSECI